MQNNNGRSTLDIGLIVPEEAATQTCVISVISVYFYCTVVGHTYITQEPKTNIKIKNKMLKPGQALSIKTLLGNNYLNGQYRTAKFLRPQVMYRHFLMKNWC